MAIHIRRREFIVTLSGAAAWPVAVAQRGMRGWREKHAHAPEALEGRLMAS
jgi:hypothetical protein